MRRNVILLVIAALSLMPLNHSTADSLLTSCSQKVNKGALAAIVGQTKALGRKDFASAFAYATSDFRKNSSVATFTQVINKGFPYLLTASNIQITDCQKMNEFYHYQVSLNSQSATFSLTYVLAPQSKFQSLSPNKTGFGIVAAALNQTQAEGSPTTGTAVTFKS